MFVQGVLFYFVLLISLVVHEAAHAVTALWGGDKTAYFGGQVTLNPVPHIQREPFGTVILPIMMLLMSGGTMCMGFAHAPIDPVWAYHNPKKAALMSAAGPISNFLLALLAVIVLKILVISEIVDVRWGGTFLDVFRPADGSIDGPIHAVCMICSVFLILNLLLGILNLIPFPPLDGAGVVGGLFPKSAGRFYENLRGQPTMMLVGMIGVFYFFYAYAFDELLIPAFSAAAKFIKN